MTGILGRLFGHGSTSNGDCAYAKAMTVSDDLIARMRDASESKDPVRAMMADIWAQRHNIPYMVSVYETVREMTVATAEYQHRSKQDSE